MQNKQNLPDWQEAPLPNPKEIIQLTELAVRGKLPPNVTEDDMYEALDKCGMTVGEIFDELDRRAPNVVRGSVKLPSDHPERIKQGAFMIELILYERFGRRLREVTAHKVPI